MAVSFRDVTSYSRSTKDRIPRTWEANIAGVRLTVTRHIFYPDDSWVVASAPSIIETQVLQSKDIEEAKDEAVELLLSKCNAVVIACK